MVEKTQSQAGKLTGIGDEKVRFVADARLISVLGEQLIGSEKVGILELIKNAYDAGASVCTVTLEGAPGLRPTDRTLSDYDTLPGPIIEIRDDGSGMSRDDLVHGWLRPATSRRAQVKERLRVERALADERGSRQAYEAMVEELQVAHGGRLPLGEKGIGRLATHRLGRYLWLRTKTKSDPLEWELKIDWADFDSLSGGPVDLSAVPLTIHHQAPSRDYGAGESGTAICCYGGRAGYKWDIPQIEDVGRAVNALRSPRRAPQSFQPRFVSPHVPETAIASPLERVEAPFELIAVVDGTGSADIEVRFEPPVGLNGSPDGFSREEQVDLRTKNTDYWRDKASGKLRAPECGPFLVHIRAWLRFSQWLGADYKPITTYLNQFGGITIYRDGLATMPAEQGAKIDWLGLQLSQIKKSANISYYQMSGEIELQQQDTLELRDRSSREGMIQTRSYLDLTKLTGAVVDQLQFTMKEVRSAWKRNQIDRIPLKTLAANAKTAASIAKALTDAYDFTADPLNIRETIGGEDPKSRVTEISESLMNVAEQLELHEQEHEGLMEAAGFGLAIGVAVHELGKLSSAMAVDVQRLQRLLGPDSAGASMLDSLQRRTEGLLDEVKRIAPLRVTRNDAARPFAVRSAIEAARNAFVGTLESSQILLHVDRGDFQINGRYGAIAQVFANLLDNAIYWVGTRGQGGAIQVSISKEDRTVLVADTGPGVSPKMERHLFEPFYSEKSPPSGLGLYICRFYLGQCGATIRVPRTAERSNLTGAQFLLDFSKTPAGLP
jgi:signal transduction histidine kinase